MKIDFDPAIFSIGAFQVRWYGLMYVFGFLLGGQLCLRLIKQKFFQLPREKLDFFVFHLIIGLFLGARIFYVFIYNWDYYSQNLSDIFSTWKGGLSFHGGAFGFFVVCLYYSRKHKIPLLQLTDVIALAGSPGLFFGRMGNFINGELYGHPTSVPWGMIFPGAGPYPRHPSMLYEGILEGIVLVAILWFIKNRTRFHGVVSAAFLIGYGSFRFFVEFFREADPQLGRFFFDIFSMGQILCTLMILFSIPFLYYTYKLRIPIAQSS